MRKSVKLILTLTIFLIIITGGITYFGPRLIVQVHGGVLSFIRPQNEIPQILPKDYGLKGEDIKLVSNDGLQLKSILFKSNAKEQKGTIILIHGIRSSKESNYSLAKRLVDSSYNAVVVDLRAHGQSEGMYCTFGFREKEDISILIDSLDRRHNLSKHIGVWGHSLGGAVALQSMAVNNKIKFGIIESTFSDFDSIVHDYTRYHLGFDLPFLTEYLIRQAGSIAHFNPEDVKPRLYARNIHQHILMVHGDCDKKIDMKYCGINFASIPGQEKRRITIKGAKHSNIRTVGGEEYIQQVFGFLNR